MRLFIIIIISALPLFVFGQGRITRPSKSVSHGRTPQKSQEVHLNNVQQNYEDSIAKLPRVEEYINNILVRWRADITDVQKEAIAEIINNLVDIEGGVFLIGSNRQDHYCDYAGTRYFIDWPEHSEKTNSFKLSKYEMTQQIWEIIMDDNPSQYWGDNLPVTNVSWYDCQNFIARIKLLSGVDFRLPTEIEWEYVARKNLPQNSSEYIKETEWVSNGADKMPHPVGTKQCNGFGIFDIIGNVREWTSDHASLDYNHPRNRYDYIARGSTYKSWSPYYFRYNFSPSDKNGSLGFRIAL